MTDGEKQRDRGSIFGVQDDEGLAAPILFYRVGGTGAGKGGLCADLLFRHSKFHCRLKCR